MLASPSSTKVEGNHYANAEMIERLTSCLLKELEQRKFLPGAAGFSISAGNRVNCDEQATAPAGSSDPRTRLPR
jgi:hypothetical protein